MIVLSTWYLSSSRFYLCDLKIWLVVLNTHKTIALKICEIIDLGCY